MVIPLVEIAARKFFMTAIPGAGAYAAALTLWLGMLGAAIAAREGKLLTLATGEFLPKGRISAVAHVFAGATGAMIATMLTMGAIVLVQSDYLAGDQITPGAPKWIADLALPIGFGLIALRLVWRASSHRAGRALAALGIVAGLVLYQYREGLLDQALLPWFALVLAAGVARRADLRAARRHRPVRVAGGRQSARRPPAAGLPGADDVDRHRGHSALYAGRLPARGREVIGAAAQAVPRVGRLGAWWNGHRRRGPVRVLHALHRRIRRDDPRARRPAAAGPHRQRVSRAFLDRPADGLRIAGAALSALAAADALRHRVAECAD